MKKILFKFLFWCLVILFLEFSFSFLIFDTFLRSSIINVFLYSIIIASFLSLITGLFKEKVDRIIHYIILIILGLLYSLQFVFYKTLKSFFSFSVLGITDQLGDFVGETVKSIFINIYGIIIFMLPLILFVVFRRKYSLNRNKLLSYMIYLLFFIVSIIGYCGNILIQKDADMSIYALYHSTNDVALNIEKTGVLSSYNLDIYRTIFGFEIPYVETEVPIVETETVFKYDDNVLDLNFNKSTSNSDIKKINNYIKKEVPTSKNEYTGLFEGYNLIYITAESFSEIAISEELTPTLFKLVNSGFKFNNFYTPNNLSTIGGEFQSLTGLFANNSILTTWRSGANYFPYGLGSVFENEGYNTYAFHNNWYQFQDRDKYFKSQGLTNYIGCGNGLQKLMNCNNWPESDLEMMKATTSKYLNSDKPFITYYMTVSGHMRYTYSGNNMAAKNKKYVENLPYNENLKAYIATQIELDRALEYLLNELEKSGKLDKTVIVLLADHYPYNLSLNNINTLSSYKRDSFVEVNHNALIIWNNRLNQKDVDKVCMSLDVLPTVLNLFNIDYDSRLIVGKDIFSNHEGLAFFANHSWVTDSGTYYANTNKFVSKKEVKDNYVTNMNNLVNNRTNMSKMIVKNNYYNYLLK